MAHRRRVTVESSSSLDSDADSDFSLASLHKTSSTSPAENSAPSSRKRKGESSDDDNDNKAKCSKRPQSQKDLKQVYEVLITTMSDNIHLGEVQQVVITAIRAVDLTLGLRRIPAGFHVAVVEWHERILLPCDPSSKVRVSVYASFELGPMLCHGELLRTFEISVGELLDRSENIASFFVPLLPLASSDTSALTLKTDAGHCVLARYRRTQNSSDLDQSINHFERTLDLCPMYHPCRPAALFNLANVKFVSCQAEQRHLDLGIPISLFQDALDLRPVGHPDRPVTQFHLAIALLSRFAKQGFQTDVHAAKELLNEVLDVCHPNSHIHRAALLAIETSALHLAASIDAHDLGHEWPAASMLPLSPNQLARKAEWCLRTDDPHVLDEVISLHYDALGYYNAMHPCRGQLLNNLGIMLSIRFERRGNAEDLDQTIALQREALALHPVGHKDRSKSLSNLAVQLSFRFNHRGNAEDLDEAIALGREALALHPVGHTDRSKSLNNLANQLSTRFDHRGNAEDLDEAIALQREALALRPVGHTGRSSSLNNLANQLSIRFDHRGNAEDLNESRENLCCALTLLTQHDPFRLKVHVSLAIVYLSFHCSGLDGSGSPGEDTDSLNAAMCHVKAAANFVPGGLLPRLRASLRWVRHADQHRHSTELEAYGTSMQLMDAYMSATASVSSRHSAMKDFPSTLAVDAASCALRSGDVCRAVELLEQGRTIIWTQMTRLRTPLDTLQTHSEHAAALTKRFRDLSSLLDRPLASHADGTQSVDVEAADTRYRRLVEDWNGVVEEIRKIEGFSRFLLPLVFADLQESAHDGPIIVLVASKSSCDAIIITHTQPPTSIQLPTDYKKLITLVLELREAIGKDASPKGNQTALIKALRKLWNEVVFPVVENLGTFAPRGSRIWWCPTSLFNFLLLHAAGEYRANGKSLSQQYISSYTPSLTALMRACTRQDRSPSVPFAAIGQNLPAGASFTLDCVEPELELVRSLLPPPPTVSFTKITSVDATKSRALCTLQDNTWLHFACHGTQNFDDPFKSAFLMRDQPLSLLDITKMDISWHEFAFLSACETAVGDFATPDEVIHLAAGLQFAGVKSVVGTLWKVNDATVQRLVEAFYKKLCGDGKMDSARAARALHQAVFSLVHDKENPMPLDQRIVFIHIGA
ncbi:CHAT domain-containing protein [Suillus occidentalis]|nr:CHAT domain-containing protein [Suillus occidentalis]